MSNYKLEDFSPGDWCLVEERCWFEEARGEVVKVLGTDRNSVYVERINFVAGTYDKFYTGPHGLFKCITSLQAEVGKTYRIVRSSFDTCSGAAEAGVANGQRIKVVEKTSVVTKAKSLDAINHKNQIWSFIYDDSRIKNIGYTLFAPCGEESTIKVVNTADYCSCSSPDLVSSFCGIGAGGNTFYYCRVCKKERL